MFGRSRSRWHFVNPATPKCDKEFYPHPVPDADRAICMQTMEDISFAKSEAPLHGLTDPSRPDYQIPPETSWKIKETFHTLNERRTTRLTEPMKPSMRHGAQFLTPVAGVPLLYGPH